MTNAHVVAGVSDGRAATLLVTLSDGRRVAARVVGRDEQSDLALVMLERSAAFDGSALPVAVMGSSSTMRAGDWVIAMGSPLGLSNSLSVGVVSAIARM